MAHYAKVVNGTVTQVIVAEADFFDTFVDDSPGEWIQTSYNANFRGLYAGIGDYYNESLDVFERIGGYHHTDTEDDINAN